MFNVISTINVKVLLYITKEESVETFLFKIVIFK